MSTLGRTLTRLALLLLIVLGSATQSVAQKTGSKARPFTLVIDPGHGGRDPGAIGRTAKEKNITLKVALALGRLVENNHPDVKVIYTRQKDVFIPLDRRAEIANRAKADLFISIHTNALPKRKIARGAETYTLGIARADANLEVAKRENSVILIESDYKQRYEDFDPNSPESYILFEFMQDKYMEQSVDLATMIQREFRTTAKRADKGVHQAGFLVLRATSMPSVLVELGFISTPDEERYMNSQAGVKALSRSIYNAFKKYKEGMAPRKSTQPLPVQSSKEKATPEPEPEVTPAPAPTHAPAKTSSAKSEVATVASERPVFKVQILTSDRRLKAGDKRLKGLSPVDYYKDGGTLKYTYGSTTNYTECKAIRRKIVGKFPQAFIVAFKSGRRVDLQEAIREAQKR